MSILCIVLSCVFDVIYHHNILIYKSQQDAHVTEFILSDDCSHVSGIIITHFQEHKTTVTTASGNCYTVLLSVAIVEESECVVGGIRHPQHTQTTSNSSTIAAGT